MYGGHGCECMDVWVLVFVDVSTFYLLNLLTLIFHSLYFASLQFVHNMFSPPCWAVYVAYDLWHELESAAWLISIKSLAGLCYCNSSSNWVQKGDTHCHLQQRYISGIKLDGDFFYFIVSGSKGKQLYISKMVGMNAAEAISYLCDYLSGNTHTLSLRKPCASQNALPHKNSIPEEITYWQLTVFTFESKSM